MTVDKLRMHSPHLPQRNVDAIAELFPAVITESLDAEGHLVRTVDFDRLRQEFPGHVTEGPQERYQLDWLGKRAATLMANTPVSKTLRPMRDESVDFDSTKNLFIEGDNLDALKLLQESYLGKVKLIYIDPPYNTGNDFVYKDSTSKSSAEYLEETSQRNDSGERLVANTEANGRFHSDWLSMLYPRLKLARNLLTDDGVLVVSIDENEHANLVRIGQELLGDASYVGEIVLKNSSKNDQAYISMQHEYIVFFVRNRQANPGKWIEKKGGLDKIYAAFEGFKKTYGTDWLAIHEAAKAWYKTFPPSDPVFASKHYNRMDERGIYFADNISGPNDGQYVYDVPHPVTHEVVKMPASGWRYPRDEMLRRIAENRVHFDADHTSVPNNKTYLANTEYQSLTSVRYVDGRAASKRLQSLFGQKVFTNPKDEYLLRDIYMALGIAHSDVVLDMFAGSGSAMQAVLELNRATGSSCRFIGIQVPEDLNASLKTARGAAKQITANAIKLLQQRGHPATVAEITKERMRLVREKMNGEILIDRGFRVLRIDSSNMTDTLSTADGLIQTNLLDAVDSVKPGRSEEDLLFQVLLDWGLDLAEPITVQQLDGLSILSVADDSLIACFDGPVTDAGVRTIAQRRPLRAVFKDDGFASDAARINAEQIFRELSPETDVKTI